MAKQKANGKNRDIMESGSLKVLGTSGETTGSVTAKAKTASLRPSMPAISTPRRRKFPWHECLMRFSRSILRGYSVASGTLKRSPPRRSGCKVYAAIVCQRRLTVHETARRANYVLPQLHLPNCTREAPLRHPPDFCPAHPARPRERLPSELLPELCRRRTSCSPDTLTSLWV